MNYSKYTYTSSYHDAICIANIMQAISDHLLTHLIVTESPIYSHVRYHEIRQV